MDLEAENYTNISPLRALARHMRDSKKTFVLICEGPPLETSIRLNHSFKMNIATRIPEGPGRKPGRRPGSGPEVETDSGNRSPNIREGFKKVSRGSIWFPRDSRKVPRRFLEGSQKVSGRFPVPGRVPESSRM